MIYNESLFIVTTVASIVSAFLHIVIKYVVSLIFKENQRATSIRSEIMSIREEMSKISMMDEFPRHARLQRKLNKLRGELSSEANSLSSSKLKYKFIATTSASVVMGIFMLTLVVMYRAEPVLLLPEKWLSPLSSLVAWPSREPGAVSTLTWLAISGCVARLVASKLS